LNESVRRETVDSVEITSIGDQAGDRKLTPVEEQALLNVVRAANLLHEEFSVPWPRISAMGNFVAAVVELISTPVWEIRFSINEEGNILVGLTDLDEDAEVESGRGETTHSNGGTPLLPDPPASNPYVALWIERIKTLVSRGFPIGRPAEWTEANEWSARRIASSLGYSTSTVSNAVTVLCRLGWLRQSWSPNVPRLAMYYIASPTEEEGRSSGLLAELSDSDIVACLPDDPPAPGEAVPLGAPGTVRAVADKLGVRKSLASERLRKLYAAGTIDRIWTVIHTSGVPVNGCVYFKKEGDR